MNKGETIFYVGLIATLTGCFTFVNVAVAGLGLMVLGAVVADRTKEPY